MLQKLELTNFRCFEHYEVPFTRFNILVGKNNSGKSTIVDALKLIANVRRYAAFRDSHLNESDIPFPMTNLRHDYLEEDSSVRAEFSDNTAIEVTFPTDDSPYAEFFRNGKNVGKERRRDYFRQSLGIIPPVSTFEDTEELGNRTYVGRVMVSHLSPRHFRNIWHLFPDDFEEFQRIVEETWPGCTVQPPEFNAAQNGIDMFFKEKRLDREISWAGHGFQVWLQLVTHLVKLGRMETLILDEPDIYLHSDMQKRLVNLCRQRSNQVIIATHAVDIIEEVEPEDVIEIDKGSKEAKRLSDIDEVQACISQLGSSQNLKLVHLYRGKTCVFLEGKELSYLKSFARRLDNQPFMREDFAIVRLQGFSNWDNLLHVDWLYRNAIGEKIKCYVLLDRDYHATTEIQDIEGQLRKRGVKAHFWRKKEIENYLLDYGALYRMFCDRFSQRHGCAKSVPLSEAQFREKLSTLAEDFKEEVRGQMVGMAVKTMKKKTPSLDEATIATETSVRFETDWRNPEFRTSAIPGKEFFGRLNSWLTEQYHVSISVAFAIRSLERHEIDPEVQRVFDDIAELTKSK